MYSTVGGKSWNQVRVLGVGLLGALVACGGETTTAPPPPAPIPQPASVSISATTDTLHSFGEQQTLVAEVRDDGGNLLPNAVVTWASLASGIIAVDDSGRVTAVANGQAAVRATAGAASASVDLVVAQAIGTLSIAGIDTVFNPGVRTRFTATATDPGGSPFVRSPIEWSSADPAVATVDATGLVLPIAGGTTTIQVTAAAETSASTFTVVPLINLQINSDLAESFQWTLEDISLPAGVMGASASIRFPNGDVWAGVFGDSDETTRIRPEMMFPIGSTQKTFISATVLKLVEQGILTLEDTVGSWIAPHPNIPGSVTIRQLLQNTSGIAGYNAHPNFLDEVTLDRNRVWTTLELLDFVGDPTSAPGTVYKSSSTGYLLAGIIVESTSGASVAATTRALVFSPLALDEVFMGTFEPVIGSLATTWNGPAGGPLDNFTTTYAGPSFDTSGYTVGSWVISARNLARWGEALFTDFLTPAVLAEMQTTVPDDGLIPGQIAAGVGVREYNYLGRTQWGHSGAGFSGGSLMIYDTASGIAVSVVYNQNGVTHGSSHFILVPELLRLALGG